VFTRLNADTGSPTSLGAAATVVGAGALVGGIAGGLVSPAFIPSYIRDNLALYRIGAAWIGAAEGATVGLAAFHSRKSGWIGGAFGLGAGAAAGAWLDRHAPNYGRVAVIQSGAAIGALAGALAVPALGLEARHAPWLVGGGLNVGLGLGLALAYLPDQRAYGPSWQRVILVDLAAAAGAFAGAIPDTIAQCTMNQRCDFDSEANNRTARLALLGGGLGLAAGWFLTRDYDKNSQAPSERTGLVGFIPTPTILPVADREGRVHALPGLAAQGRF
jgi:hypothetical protein